MKITRTIVPNKASPSVACRGPSPCVSCLRARRNTGRCSPGRALSGSSSRTRRPDPGTRSSRTTGICTWRHLRSRRRRGDSPRPRVAARNDPAARRLECGTSSPRTGWGTPGCTEEAAVSPASTGHRSFLSWCRSSPKLDRC
jgi:hypothetical protein